MLYHLLISLYPQISVFNVVRYITFRTAMAAVTAILLLLLLGPTMIRSLKQSGKHAAEKIRASITEAASDHGWPMIFST